MQWQPGLTPNTIQGQQEQNDYQRRQADTARMQAQSRPQNVVWPKSSRHQGTVSAPSAGRGFLGLLLFLFAALAIAVYVVTGRPLLLTIAAILVGIFYFKSLAFFRFLVFVVAALAIGNYFAHGLVLTIGHALGFR